MTDVIEAKKERGRKSFSRWCFDDFFFFWHPSLNFKL
jgi:hypothetical protein